MNDKYRDETERSNLTTISLAAGTLNDGFIFFKIGVWGRKV